jgi:uncharacterized membrane protein (DUF2068 family)
MLPERPQRDRCASAWHAVNLATFGGDSASATLESRRKFVPLAKFRDMTAPSHRTPLVDRTSFLRIVSVYKFLQALLLSGVGLATLRLVRPEVAAEFGQWVQDLPVGFIQHTAVTFLEWITGPQSSRVLILGGAILAYAALFFVEAVGLWFQKRWAEWLTVIATAALIPPEIYECVVHPSPLPFVLLALNVAVVAMLVQRLRHELRKERLAHG